MDSTPGRAWCQVLVVCGCPTTQSRPDLTLFDPTDFENFEESLKLATSRQAKKRARQNEKRRLRNQSIKSELKTLVRKTREAADGGDKELAEENLRIACQKLDRAAAKGVIHKNQAANRKSKLAKHVQKQFQDE